MSTGIDVPTFRHVYLKMDLFSRIFCTKFEYEVKIVTFHKDLQTRLNNFSTGNLEKAINNPLFRGNQK